MRTRRFLWVVLVLALASVFAVVMVACGSGTTSEPTPTASGQSASGLKRILVGDLSVRVPAEWRSYDYDFGPGWNGVSLFDPRHEPSDAVIFGFYFQEEPGMTAVEMGKVLADSERASVTRERRVVFPSGIHAYEVQLRDNQNGKAYATLTYALVAPSSSGTRGYLVMYRAVDSQAGHLTQFRASARSINTFCSTCSSTQQGGSQELKRVVIGDLSIAVPADWQPLEADAEDTTTMADPAGTVMVMCMRMEELPGMTATEQGRSFADSLKEDKDFSAVQEHLAVLPSGIRAYEVRYNLDSDGETVAGLQYSLVIGKRLNVITYQVTGSLTESMAQVRASVRSIRSAKME